MICVALIDVPHPRRMLHLSWGWQGAKQRLSSGVERCTGTLADWRKASDQPAYTLGGREIVGRFAYLHEGGDVCGDSRGGDRRCDSDVL